jgi:hypothetical protein
MRQLSKWLYPRDYAAGNVGTAYKKTRKLTAIAAIVAVGLFLITMGILIPNLGGALLFFGSLIAVIVVLTWAAGVLNNG